MSSKRWHIDVVASITESYLGIDEQFDNIQRFASWLHETQSEYMVLPPAIVLINSNKRLAFVMRRGDDVIGVFNTPVQALLETGDSALLEAYLAASRRFAL